jgi:hypothetical protein
VVTRTSTIRLTGYHPNLASAPGEAFTFDVDGKTIRAERWATTGTSGLDYLDDDRNTVEVDEDVQAAMDELMDAFDTTLGEQFAARGIDEQIRAATAAALAAAGEATATVTDTQD